MFNKFRINNNSSNTYNQQTTSGSSSRTPETQQAQPPAQLQLIKYFQYSPGQIFKMSGQFDTWTGMFDGVVNEIHTPTGHIPVNYYYPYAVPASLVGSDKFEAERLSQNTAQQTPQAILGSQDRQNRQLITIEQTLQQLGLTDEQMARLSMPASRKAFIKHLAAAQQKSIPLADVIEIARRSGSGKTFQTLFENFEALSSKLTLNEIVRIAKKETAHSALQLIGFKLLWKALKSSRQRVSRSHKWPGSRPTEMVGTTGNS